jgi:hypothetical protein
LTSLRRVPVFSTMDSATSLRWWFAAIPYRSRRHPAWSEGTFRLTSSAFQRAHVILKCCSKTPPGLIII